MERRELEDMLAQGWSLERIGRHVGKHPETVSYWLRKYGLRPVNQEKHAARDALRRDDLEALVSRGLTLREIAAEVDRSLSTVRHWLLEYGLQTTAVARRRTKATPGARIQRVCRVHGETEFVGRPDGGGWRCVRCRSARVANWRRRMKQKLVEEAGGKCVMCGYGRCQAALEFHHLDPQTKRFRGGTGGRSIPAEGAGGGCEVRATVLELPRRGGVRLR